MATTGFSLELASGALTRCQGLSLISLCWHGGTLVASDGGRLYRMGGDTDDGAAIPCRMSLPATDCGQAGPKRLRAVRLIGHLGGAIEIAATSDAGTSLSGTAGPAGSEGLPASSQARLGRGQGRFWTLDLVNEEGTAMDIGAIVLDPVPLDRRGA